MEILFGKSYETVGNSGAGLLLKSSGDVKAQIGNKFIDLVSTQDLGSSGFYAVSEMPNSQSPNGLYLVNGSELYAVINGWVSRNLQADRA